MRWFMKMLAKFYEIATDQYYRMRYESYREKYKLSETFKFNGPGTLFYGGGSITIGAQTYVGHQCFLQASEKFEISIGAHCAISHFVKIYTSAYDADQDFASVKRKLNYGSVKIGDGVWIGANVFIGPGITIGDNSVIGTNAVVTRDVESNTIVGGVPAKFIRKKNKQQ